MVLKHTLINQGNIKPPWINLQFQKILMLKVLLYFGGTIGKAPCIQRGLILMRWF